MVFNSLIFVAFFAIVLFLHLSRTCATVFTDAYLRDLAGKTPLLHLQPGAPRALSTRNCVRPSPAGLR